MINFFVPLFRLWFWFQGLKAPSIPYEKQLQVCSTCMMHTGRPMHSRCEKINFIIHGWYHDVPVRSQRWFLFRFLMWYKSYDAVDGKYADRDIDRFRWHGYLVCRCNRCILFQIPRQIGFGNADTRIRNTKVADGIKENRMIPDGSISARWIRFVPPQTTTIFHHLIPLYPRCRFPRQSACW